MEGGGVDLQDEDHDGDSDGDTDMEYDRHVDDIGPGRLGGKCTGGGGAGIRVVVRACAWGGSGQAYPDPEEEAEAGVDDGVVRRGRLRRGDGDGPAEAAG